MSNQVYKNDTVKYDLANFGYSEYVLTANQAVAGVSDDLKNLSLFRDDNLGDYVSYVAATGIWTVKKSGLYTVDAVLRIANSALGTYRAGNISYTPLSEASTNLSQTIVAPVGGIALTSIALHATLKMDYGDTFKISFEQDTGGAINLIGAGADPRCKVVISRIA